MTTTAAEERGDTSSLRRFSYLKGFKVSYRLVVGRLMGRTETTNAKLHIAMRTNPIISSKIISVTSRP